MDYILGALIFIGIISNFFICKYFISKISEKQTKVIEAYHKEWLQFSITQKENTEKLVTLLNKLFITSESQIKSEPNDIGKTNVDEIEFAEENIMKLPSDIKFEVEGGDSSVPPGYPQVN